MLDRFKLSILLQGLTLLVLSPASVASSLGLTVHVVPLDSSGGKTVRAHFSVITPSPCPDLSAVCAVGEDCEAHRTSLPFNYTKPSPAWCVRQWQKTVPSNYNDTLTLGPSTQFYVSINAGPKIRANNGKLNRPAFVAQPPPLRARQNCPTNFDLSVKDLDGDRVRCRFAHADKGECLNCPQHAFIKLDEEKCILTFTGNAAPGQYFIYLMADDLIPVPTFSQVLDITPLSSVPVHLSLSVEAWTSSCGNGPVATGGTPEKHSVLFALPYQEVRFNTDYTSDLESVVEVAVVGPPDLYRVGFASVDRFAKLTVAWIRSENNLTRILPICFVANTLSLQSELRCVWLYQREMKTLPAGTELKCNETEMTLVLPVTSFTDINMAELQLNSPTCPITYNSTHLTAHINLNGCGTKAVHTGSELVYTNTLKSVRPYTMISRTPSLILPLACRIPGVQVKGPHYAIEMPTERETFGEVRVWLEIHLPGQGPLARFTANPRFRSLGRARREADSGSANIATSTPANTNRAASMVVGSRLKQLDLYVMSNCSTDRAEMVVSKCRESETADFATNLPFLDKGCLMSNGTLEVITTTTNSKVYRMDLDTMSNNGTTMYVECQVYLCIATMPSAKCPDLCNHNSSSSSMVDSVFTSMYTVRSNAVSLLVTTAAPTTISTSKSSNTGTTTTKPPIVVPAQGATTSFATSTNTTASSACALETASSITTGVILTIIHMILQTNLLR